MTTEFYSHVICLGTKIKSKSKQCDVRFYSHVICLGTKMNYLLLYQHACFTVT